MLCSKCAASLPEGSQFCLKCGQAVTVPAENAAEPAATVLLGCSKCGANLPDGAQFCLKCGKPVSSPAKRAAIANASASELPRPRHTRRVALWLLLAIFAGVVLWAATSDNPVAQQVQEIVGWKHDQTVLDTPFSVGAHTFRYYKFSLPEGSVNVAIVGQFAAASDNHNGSDRKDKDVKKDDDSTIEVFVLSEPAFTVWQNGYATGSLYESGKVAEGTVHGDLPAGAGIYYLVFSNKSAPKTAKSVHATVLLRYKSWLPEWFRRMKDRFWNWLGL